MASSILVNTPWARLQISADNKNWFALGQKWLQNLFRVRCAFNLFLKGHVSHGTPDCLGKITLAVPGQLSIGQPLLKHLTTMKYRDAKRGFRVGGISRARRIMQRRQSLGQLYGTLSRHMSGSSTAICCRTNRRAQFLSGSCRPNQTLP